MLGDARTAEDVAQEALLRAWRHAGVFDPRRGSVVSWLLTITRNLAIDTIRVRRPIAIDPDVVLAWSPPAPAGDPTRRPCSPTTRRASTRRSPACRPSSAAPSSWPASWA